MGLDLPRWVRPLLLGIGALMVVGSLWYMGWALLRASAATDWPQVEGRVVATNVRLETSTSDDGRRSRTTTSHTPEVTYTYSVAGRAYRSNDLWLIAPTAYSDPAEAQALINRYPVGGAIPVHYDPQNPSRAALLFDSPPWQMLIVTVMGLVWFAFAWFVLGKRGGGFFSSRPKPASRLVHASCRYCGTPLPNTRTWRHDACPNCGHPRPFNAWRCRLPMLLFLTMFAAIVGGVFYLVFFA